MDESKGMSIYLLAVVETVNLIGDANWSLMFGPFVADIKAMGRSHGVAPSRFYPNGKESQSSFSRFETALVPLRRSTRSTRRQKEVWELSDDEDEGEPYEKHNVRKHSSNLSRSHMEQHLTALFCLLVRLRYRTNCHWKQGILF
jgi:hypothetical protein